VVVPNDLIEVYGADAVRYWAASARLGSDTANDEQIFKVGKKLVVKLFNASKFVLNGSPEYINVSDITEPLDLSTVHLFNEYLDEITESMENFQFSEALNKLEDFFWNYFTDNYIELVKNRSKFNDYGHKTISGLTTLRLILENLLKLFAPFIPMVTEEIWGWIYRNNSSNYKSIHLEKWPEKINLDFKNINSSQLVIAREAIGAVRKEKTNEGLSLGSDLNNVSLSVNKQVEGTLRDVIDDVKDAARSQSIEINIGSNEGVRASID